MNYEQQSETFVVAIDGNGDIWHIHRGRKQAVCGVDTQKYNELQAEYNELKAEFDSFYNRLVELGEIVPEKTPEELTREAAENQNRLLQEQMSEQSKINAELLNSLRDMKREITSLSQRIDETPTPVEVVELTPVKEKGGRKNAN